jgi:hypothetical protein
VADSNLLDAEIFSSIMAREITNFAPEEVAEVSRFLIENFGAPENAAFAAPDVLRWKYFDRRAHLDVPRGFVARQEGRLVCFGGICTSSFHVGGDKDFEVSTMHGIDWISLKEQANIGALVMMRGLRQTETAYALGGTSDAQRMVEAAGYRLVTTVPVFRRVLRPSHQLRAPGSWGLRVVRSARDAVQLAVSRNYNLCNIILKNVCSFGMEVDALLEEAEPGMVFTRRRPDVLNHYLRYPRPALSGWLLEQEGRAIGFALLGVVPRGKVRVGKIVECFLPGSDPVLWRTAIVALTEELKKQGADFALACGSNDWTAAALEAAGYRALHRLGLWLRDRKKRIPHAGSWHVTFLEADYAYTP